MTAGELSPTLSMPVKAKSQLAAPFWCCLYPSRTARVPHMPVTSLDLGCPPLGTGMRGTASAGSTQLAACPAPSKPECRRSSLDKD